VFKIEAALLVLRSGSLSYGIMSAALNVSMSSSSSVKLPRRSWLRMVDGRRVKSEGKCDPRVDIAVDESLVRGRNSFEFARRGRLAERGPGEGGCFGGVEVWSVMAARNSQIAIQAVIGLPLSDKKMVVPNQNALIGPVVLLSRR
jgi:hypothetical protein